MGDLGWSTSRTEAQLTEFVQRLTAQMTDEDEIELVPSQVWSTDRSCDPPKVHYRVADVAVVGDKLLPMIAHEIASLKFTDPSWHWTFKVRRPNASGLAFDVAEGARIDREFAERYPGAASLFEMQHGDGVTGIWTAEIAKGFKDLPAKWKLLLNADRMLWGLDPLGTPEDRAVANEAIDSFVAAALSSSSQDCADALKPAIEVLDRVMDEEREHQRRIDEATKRIREQQQLAAQANLRQDLDDPDKLRPDEEDADLRTGEVTDHAFEEGAEQDDRQIGGEDGTAGARELADGAPNGGDQEDGEDGDGDATEAESGGGTADGTDGDEMSGDGVSGGGGGDEEDTDDDWDSDDLDAMSGGGSLDGDLEDCEPCENDGGGGDGDPTNKADHGGDEDDANEDDANVEDDDAALNTGGVKPSNLLEVMAQEQAGTNNRTMRELRKQDKQRAKDAKDIQRKMEEESRAFVGEASDVVEGRGVRDRAERMAENAKVYTMDKQRLARPIHRLKTHIEGVLRDNARQSWGGNYVAGRHVKRGKLHRISTGDLRLFDRREVIGGRSYAVAILVDQSLSMSDRPMTQQEDGSWSYSSVPLQYLAYDVALVLHEAAADKIELHVMGFSEFMRTEDVYGYYRSRGRRRRLRGPTEIVMARTYHQAGDDPRLAMAKLPELRRSWNSTPTAQGISHAREALMDSDAEVKAIIIITDGQPNSTDQVRAQTLGARRDGVGTHCLLIQSGQHYHGESARLRDFLACMDSVQEVKDPDRIAPAAYATFRSIVRRTRAVA